MDSNTTIYQYYYKSVLDRILFEADAKGIMDSFMQKVNTEDTSMPERWNDPLANYPMPQRKIWAMWLDATALEWIDKNAPEHWARPSFLPAGEREEFFDKLGV